MGRGGGGRTAGAASAHVLPRRASRAGRLAAAAGSGRARVQRLGAGLPGLWYASHSRGSGAPRPRPRTRPQEGRPYHSHAAPAWSRPSRQRGPPDSSPSPRRPWGPGVRSPDATVQPRDPGANAPPDAGREAGCGRPLGEEAEGTAGGPTVLRRVSGPGRNPRARRDDPQPPRGNRVWGLCLGRGPGPVHPLSSSGPDPNPSPSYGREAVNLPRSEEVRAGRLPRVEDRTPREPPTPTTKWPSTVPRARVGVGGRFRRTPFCFLFVRVDVTEKVEVPVEPPDHDEQQSGPLSRPGSRRARMNRPLQLTVLLRPLKHSMVWANIKLKPLPSTKLVYVLES